ncbi:MAG: SelB C-terminal domain-containing protein [Myxococcota bacterium]|nr:SelB C-terminal domain-containing protein [Myxococcota bacterium]
MIIATAGHVDHGKTTLIRALTGTECDRLKEEVDRGITIQLGYAKWPLRDRGSVSVVDVPGHETLIKTMLTGLGCVDGVLMVVSAATGFMPQTWEHLNACWVLGIKNMLVAMTFADKVDDLDEAKSRINTQLAKTPYREAPICAVDATSNTGLDTLTDAACRIFSTLPRRDSLKLPMCLPIDRIFSVEGHGTVVTGSLVRGQLSRERRVQALPSGRVIRIRAIQTHGEDQQVATCGQRVAVNLAVERSELQKDRMLVETGAIELGRVLDVEIIWLPHNSKPLVRERALTFHMATSRALADVQANQSIKPGSLGTGRIRLDRRIPVPPGFHFVLRGQASHDFGGIIGGGRILDGHPVGRRRPAALTAFSTMDIEQQCQALIAAAGLLGIDSDQLVRRLPVPRGDRKRLYSQTALETARQQLMTRVNEFHGRHPHRPGIPQAELIGQPIDAAALELALDARVLKKSNGCIASLAHDLEIDPEIIKTGRKLMRAIGRAGLMALRKEELFARFPKSRELLIASLKHLIENERVIISEGFCFPAKELLQLRRDVASACLKGQPLAVSWLKTNANMTRKYSIPVWTWLDACGTTRRVGDQRVAGPKARAYVDG